MGKDYIGEDFSIPGKPTSIWIGTTPDTHLPSLKGEPEFDTVIVGGGLAGITTAYLLKKAGQKVAIVEMRDIIKDVSGHTTAKVTSQHGLIYKYLIDNFGFEKAKICGEAWESAKEKVAEIVENEEIECDFTRISTYVFSNTEGGRKEIEAETNAAIDLGLPAILVDDIPLSLENNGAIRFDNQAIFHPRKYLLSLSNEVIGNGSYIYENTRALNIKEGERCELVTDKGSLFGKNVVIATHFPFYDKGQFFTKIEPIRSYVYAVKLRDEVPEGAFYTREEKMYSFRPVIIDNERLFLIGGVQHKAGQGGNEEDCYKELENFARENFPVLAFLYHWSTQDNYTTDRIPFIGLSPKSKNVYLATGFGGWGMVNGTLSGMIISDLILGNENKYAKVFSPEREKPISAAKSFFTQNINVAKQIIIGKAPGGHEFEFHTDIKPGEGQIISYGGEKVASYKDKMGREMRLSPKCTHMGCTVEWNEAEKTWDCPCHGSRYLPDGTVLHGPALRDLEEKE